jgi:hypothetical protein
MKKTLTNASLIFTLFASTAHFANYYEPTERDWILCDVTNHNGSPATVVVRKNEYQYHNGYLGVDFHWYDHDGNKNIVEFGSTPFSPKVKDWDGQVLRNSGSEFNPLGGAWYSQDRMFNTVDGSGYYRKYKRPLVFPKREMYANYELANCAVVNPY